MLKISSHTRVWVNESICKFVGPTEKAVLANCDNIVEQSLPLAKIQQHYEEISDSCRQVVLGYVTHYEVVQQVNYLTFYFAITIKMDNSTNKVHRVKANLASQNFIITLSRPEKS